MKTMFTLVNSYHFTLSDLENLMPWERDSYLELVEQHLKELENDR